MQKSLGLNAFSYEAREFAENILRASKNLYALISMVFEGLIAFLGKPKMKRQIDPGVFEDVESAPPPGPSPWSSPPGSLF